MGLWEDDGEALVSDAHHLGGRGDKESVGMGCRCGLEGELSTSIM